MRLIPRCVRHNRTRGPSPAAIAILKPLSTAQAEISKLDWILLNARVNPFRAALTPEP